MARRSRVESFNRFATALPFAVVVALILKNLALDPFGVFGSDLVPLGRSTNERFTKVEWLCSLPANSYDGLLLGSSRSGMTNPNLFAERRDSKYYNLSVFSARPSDMLLLYKAWRDCQGAPTDLVLGLDVIAFMADQKPRGLSQRHHPRTMGTSRIGYFTDYLLSSSPLVSLEKVLFQHDPHVSFDVTRGTYSLIAYDRLISEDHETYQQRFEQPPGPSVSVDVDDGEFLSLVELIDVLARDGVRVRMFLQPMHQQWADRLGALPRRVKSRLGAITHYQDLSSLGAQDNSLWYERKHYRAPLARRVAAALRSQPPLDARSESMHLLGADYGN